MSVVSLEFLIFCAVVFIIYYLLPGSLQWIWLLISSLYFYFDISYYPIQFAEFIVIIFINYLAAVLMKEDGRRRKTIYICALIFDVLCLALFKYSRFFYNIFLAAGDLLHVNLQNNCLERFVFLCEEFQPLRISYFGLILIGYITDVYWRKNEALKNPCKLMLFTGFFPLMTSGPIVSLDQMKDELFSNVKKRFSYDVTIRGLERILWGTFKKIVISERCAVLVNSIYNYYESFRGFYIPLAASLFALQLYCDFSGLMDIVIGLSECFGIRLPENFDTPFYSLNLSEFWRRWHITLGGFLRDYVLYPIQRSSAFKKLRKACKNKFGKGYEKHFNLPLYLSLLISWFLIGLWHGGGWNYIFGVGLYMWMIIVLGDICKPLLNGLTKILHIETDCDSYKLFLRIRTFIIFMFGLSFFRAESLSDGFKMWKLAFSAFNPWIFFDESLYNLGLDRKEWGILLIGVILLFIVSYISQKENVRDYLKKQNFVFRLIIFAVLFIMCISWGYYGMSFDATDFIYGRF